MKVIVVGAGIFGVTASRALARRGHAVTLLEPGPLPHPLAESTDISKVVRMDYGGDATYTAWMERALDGWRAWNRSFPRPLFHETGVLFLTRGRMAPGGFEHDSFATVTARGHRLERLDAAAIRARFPAWDADRYTDGYLNPQGGYAESGEVVAQLAREAEALGVERLSDTHALRVALRGVLVDGGKTLTADAVVVAAGAWTAPIVPELAGRLRTVGQPVFHLAPSDPSLFAAERFPVFGADVARSGWYGFPATSSGLVKIANHGPGRPMHPESPARAITDDDTAALRAFLREALPRLADAKIAATRVCVYCDTDDEHFLIGRPPAEPWLTVATGGSGHAFKFAPLLGDWIADSVEGAEVPERFGWREPASAGGREAARHRPG